MSYNTVNQTRAEEREDGIIWVSQESLLNGIRETLVQYPWMLDYPVHCHRKCARWDIASEHGSEAGEAYAELDAKAFLLGLEWEDLRPFLPEST